MIIVLKPGTREEETRQVQEFVEAQGVQVSKVVGTDVAILGLVGDTSRIDAARIEAIECVEKILRVVEPFKKANRLFHPEDAEVRIGDQTIGGKKLAIIAGPCSVESEDQILGFAQDVKRMGAQFLSGGAFKPRTSPYAFQGLQ